MEYLVHLEEPSYRKTTRRVEADSPLRAEQLALEGVGEYIDEGPWEPDPRGNFISEQTQEVIHA